MRKRIALVAVLMLSGLIVCSAEQKKSTDTKKDTLSVKTGWGVGPLPKISYDADNGFSAGIQLSVNNYKDGKLFPNPYNSTYLDFGWYQKGIWNVILSHDNRNLIPGVRTCFAVQFCDDKFSSFYGLNGYQSNYSTTLFDFPGAQPGQGAGRFYGTHRRFVNCKIDAVGEILPHFSWEAGYHFIWINIMAPSEPGKGCYGGDNYLYNLYGKWGIIPSSQLGGGLNSELRLGLCYDTRDSEATPSRGMWAEGHLIAAPKWLGTSVPYYRFSLNWRHYVPIYRDRLTFAYRLVYQGFFNNNAPWYMLPFYTVCGPRFDLDGVGGFRTLRGIMLNRIQGLHTAFFNTELRWRIYDFRLWRQSISICASGFFEGGLCVKPFNVDYNALGTASATPDEQVLYHKYIDNSTRDKFHLSAGGGLRLLFNRNFVIACEWGKALNCTDRRFGIKNQDAGNKVSFYFNTGFTF